MQFIQTGKESIARRIALTGVMSRADAGVAIANGRVTVDGVVVKNKCSKCADVSSVELDGVSVPAPPLVPRLWGLIKPRGVHADSRLILKNSNESNLSTLIQKWTNRDVSVAGPVVALESGLPTHFVVVNKIASNSNGIVLITTDSLFADSLKSVDSKVLTTYRIKTHNISDSTVDKLTRWKWGVGLPGLFYGPVFVEVQSRTSSGTVLIVRVVANKDRNLDDLLWYHANIRMIRCSVYAFGPYRATDLTHQCVTPLAIHPSISHLIPKREINQTLIRSPDS